MNKEEMENIAKDGRDVAFKVCSCVFVFEVIWNMFMKQQSYGICALFFTFATVEGLVKYRSLHKKSGFISIIVCSVATVISLVCFVLSSFYVL